MRKKQAPRKAGAGFASRALDSIEQLVLLALTRRSDGDGYGVSVRREIADVGGRTLALATVYATLDRLERQGLVRSWLSDPLPERGGRARKCYAVEPAGARLLLRSRATLDRMWEGLELGPARR